MSSKAKSIKSAVADFMVKRGIPGEMEQNLVKEAIHLHLLSALSDAGVKKRLDAWRAKQTRSVAKKPK